MHIVEGVASVWHYHLSKSGISGQPTLCGNKQVMCTMIPLETWGTKTHLRETYCKECAEEAKNIDKARQ